jgi:hypothetical protein
LIFQSTFWALSEPGTTRTLEEVVKADHIVFDIGANVGAQTLTLARSVGGLGKVYAFEPSDFEIEERTVARQILLSATGSDLVERAIDASWPLRPADPVHPKHRGSLVSGERSRQLLHVHP